MEEVHQQGLEKTISSLPPEVLQEIFKRLNLQSLKAAREVCSTWNKLIYKEAYFLNKICLVHHALGYDESNKEINFVNSVASTSLIINHLRLQQLYCSKYELNSSLDKLFLWMSSYALNNITQLEIKSSQILLSHFFLILNKLSNICHLIINDETLIWHPFSNSSAEALQPTDWIWFNGEKLLRQIINLEVSIKDVHEFLFTLHDSNLVNCFQSLQNLHLVGSLGRESDLSAGHVLGLILKQSHYSLKILKLDAFPCQVFEFLNESLNSYDATCRDKLFVEFNNFCQLLIEPITQTDSIEPEEESLRSLSFNHLEELSLNRFPIADMNYELVNESLIPFLSKLINLRKFSIGQLYFSNDLNCHDFISLFPPSCKIQLTSVHLHVPLSNVENILSVLHPNRAILKYSRSSVELEYDNVRWKIIYCTWDSFCRNNLWLQNHLSRLVKLRLFNVAFNIGDKEIQFIIKGGRQLVELHFELCNMETLTDVGLTGISSHVCAKLRIDKRYQINKEKDFVGTPLSNLAKLKSLYLSQVGEYVTDATARTAFDSISNLKYLTIRQNPQMLTQDGIDHIVNKRQVHFEYFDSMDSS